MNNRPPNFFVQLTSFSGLLNGLDILTYTSYLFENYKQFNYVHFYFYLGPQECTDELCIAWVNSNQCEVSVDLMAQFCPASCCEPGGVPSTPSTVRTSTVTTRTPSPSTTTQRTVTVQQGTFLAELLNDKYLYIVTKPQGYASSGNLHDFPR